MLQASQSKGMFEQDVRRKETTAKKNSIRRIVLIEDSEKD
jgi:hypothetical protein